MTDNKKPVPRKKRRTKNDAQETAREQDIVLLEPEEKSDFLDLKDGQSAANSHYDSSLSLSQIGFLRQEAAEQQRQSRDLRQEAATTVGIFVSALKNQTILESTISGVDCIGDEVYWVCYESTISIRIPYSDAFDTVTEELVRNNSETIRTRKQQLMAKSIGAKVSYILTSMVANNDSTFSAIGSRIRALSVIRKFYTGPNSIRPLEPGLDMTAQILSVSAHALYVSVCGFDCIVRNYDLTHRYIQNLQTAYQPGDSIRLKLMNVTQENGKYTLQWSHRPIELNNLKPNLLRIQNSLKEGVHPVFSGVVTTTRVDTRDKDNPKLLITLFLEGVNVPAFSRNNKLYLDENSDQGLYSGDVVLFRVRGTTANGYAVGDIIRIIRRH